MLRQSDGGVNVVLNGPRLDRVKVSVKVALEDVSQVVSLTVVMISLDIARASRGLMMMVVVNGRD